MTRIPYIAPSVKLISIRFDTVFCVSTTTTEPFEDNGDYEWD